MPVWDQFLTERDRQVFGAAGYGKQAGFGQRPVVLIIDVNYNFVGDRPEPILESVKRWRNSCGEEGWTAMGHIRTLVEAARPKGIPIIYSTGAELREDNWDSGRWASKNARRDEDAGPNRVAGNDIPELIAPRTEDIVIRKSKPSVFFGTLLAAYLIDLQADTLITCGTTTGGCVRATVLDGFSYNYRIAIVEECTFDRGQASHAINLFDMQQKYADVVPLSETVEYLGSLPEGLFDDRMPILRQRRALAGAGAGG